MVFLPYEKKDFSDRIINELIYEGRTWWAGWEENSRKSEQRQEPVQRFCGVRQWSPTFLASGTGFVEDSFSTAGEGGGWVMIQAVMRAMGGMVQAVMRAMGSDGSGR